MDNKARIVLRLRLPVAPLPVVRSGFEAWLAENAEETLRTETKGN